jgi:hypothetical protein
MQSSAKTVSAYLLEVPELRRECLAELRRLCLTILKTDVVNANRPALKGLSVGKGCIRYSSPRKVDFAVVERLLSGTLHSPNSVC